MKICINCDQSIRTGEGYTEIDKMSPSAAGTTLYRHDRECKPVPVQTTQVSLHH
ncbi:hypothetical protein R6V09_01125 [Streptomyces sp. W16]|uniref:hypothetical protein n=1 Tax=Streptomyces sp. W16 TaxID=3076631 RepID=UPI00295AAC41|nr:hypothetical protein [Streptomyces sp. W16]MDV9168745.1 hypothetical protein [Streptomyces sp. W16]